MVKQGDIIWLNFDPQAGHEQRGRRPALIVSNESFNNFSKLAIVCPITNRDKEHPFHIKLDDRTKTTGVILCDQVRTLALQPSPKGEGSPLDINARNFEYIEHVTDDILFDVLDIVNGFMEIEK
ncbi:mRNA-degrading endonuclease [Spirochaetia bacterium]|nr:mRNA-degrading endonuclease [Spirochaetia bacterium]